MLTTEQTILKIENKLSSETITFDVYRKLPDGTVYLEPITFARTEIKSYCRGGSFDYRGQEKQTILVKKTNFPNMIELEVKMKYADLKEIMDDFDVFEKVKLI